MNTEDKDKTNFSEEFLAIQMKQDAEKEMKNVKETGYLFLDDVFKLLAEEKLKWFVKTQRE